MIDRGGLFDSTFEEVDLAVLELIFQYSGAHVRASDPQERLFASHGSCVLSMPRDFDAEARARRTLEGFGAVDLACLEHYGVAPDSRADYVIRVDGDVHSQCAFTAYALPQLRQLGWRVEVDGSYPYQVVEGDLPWYAVVEPEEERPDWFSLEMGVELDGERINLLPVLVDLLDDSSGSLKALARRSLERFALPIGTHRYVMVPPDRLRSLLHVVIELYAGGPSAPAAIAFPAMKAPVLTQLEALDAPGALEWDDESGVRTRARALSEGSREPIPPPGGLRAELRPYQQDGLDWLQQLRRCGVGGVLADDMGLGKTLQTIAHIATEHQAGRLDTPALVVAPTSLVGNWQREMGKFAPHLRVVAWHGPRRHEREDELSSADVIVTSYPLLVRDENRFTASPVHLLVLDEAHTIKNRRSLSHQAVKRIDARHRVCLTGTPVENHLGELWSLFDFLNPGLLGDEAVFRQWYRAPIERQGDTERLEALQQHVSPYILRRLKEEVAPELPPKTELMTPVELSGKQRELYESIRIAAHTRVRSIIRKKGLAASTIPILDALMKLRQICCDPRLLRMEAARFVRDSAKYQALFDLLRRQLGQGRRILLFSQFTSMLALIARGLEEERARYVSLTGSTRDRQAVIDSFEKRRADVFLISLKAGGTGLNLVSADTVIHYDPWWNPAAQAQATDRAYRIGQTRPVFVHNLFVAGSVEERMIQLQRTKRRLADAILGGGPTDAAAFTEHEVEELFAPLPEAE